MEQKQYFEAVQSEISAIRNSLNKMNELTWLTYKDQIDLAICNIERLMPDLIKEEANEHIKKAWDAFRMRVFPHNTDNYGNETFEQFLQSLK